MFSMKVSMTSAFVKGAQPLADVAQMVEHVLGKDEVGSSILLISSCTKKQFAFKAQAINVCAALS
jgi:hypothetical protein